MRISSSFVTPSGPGACLGFRDCSADSNLLCVMGRVIISSWGSSGHCINFFVSSVISALRLWLTPVLLTVLNWFNSAVLVAGCERFFPSFSIAIGACLLSSLLRLLTSDHSLLPSFSRLRVEVFSFQLDLIADKVSFFSFAVFWL